MKKILSMALTLMMSISTLSLTTMPASAKAEGTVRLEAEKAQLSGSSQIENGITTASNGSFISYIDEVGNAVTFKNVPAAKSISIGFARVNDVHSQDISFPNTGDWAEIKCRGSKANTKTSACNISKEKNSKRLSNTG
jgi:hypothetical protein